jgi:UDP-2,4-diacetamido-2,4,6-trideoxy-beta-L-altropyranose hydrolase
MKVFFRVDASAQMGAGHFMRCLTLAESLRNRSVQVAFVCREHEGNLIEYLRQRDIPVSVLGKPGNGTFLANDYATWLGTSQSEDAEQTASALCDLRPEWLVVDHYAIDAEWETRLRPHIGNLFVIDDLANRKHACDVLLDQNYSFDEDRYSSLVPAQCRLLLGPKYALLRSEFARLRPYGVPTFHELDSILIFFTAGNDQGETLKAMQGVHRLGKPLRVDVVVGGSNPDNPAIQEMCSEMSWNFHCQVDNMAELIAKADMVIGAGGSSNWERCAFGRPALVAILSDNQAPIAHALASAGAVMNLGWAHKLTSRDYMAALAAITPEQLATMSRKASGLVDAVGTQRITDLLLAAQSKSIE